MTDRENEAPEVDPPDNQGGGGSELNESTERSTVDPPDNQGGGGSSSSDNSN
jgi:hypothetical protein